MARARARLLGPYALLYIYRRRLRVHACAEAVRRDRHRDRRRARARRDGRRGQHRRLHAPESSTRSSGRRRCSCARNGQGFDERVLARVEAIPGVKQAAPLLEQTATVVAANGRRVTRRPRRHRRQPRRARRPRAHAAARRADSRRHRAQSRASAKALGLDRSHSSAAARQPAAARALDPLRVSAVLGAEAAGAVSGALVAVMPLARLQQPRRPAAPRHAHPRAEPPGRDAAASRARLQATRRRAPRASRRPTRTSRC